MVVISVNVGGSHAGTMKLFERTTIFTMLTVIDIGLNVCIPTESAESFTIAMASLASSNLFPFVVLLLLLFCCCLSFGLFVTVLIPLSSGIMRTWSSRSESG